MQDKKKVFLRSSKICEDRLSDLSKCTMYTKVTAWTFKSGHETDSNRRMPKVHLDSQNQMPYVFCKDRG